MDNVALIEAVAGRVDAAAADMLASASDAAFGDGANFRLTLLTVIFDTVRNAFERDLDATAVEALQGQSKSMCRSYLGTVRKTGADIG